jgi:hypothetical protein
MLIHSQVPKPATPARATPAQLGFVERNKNTSPFAWISFADEAKKTPQTPQK